MLRAGPVSALTPYVTDLLGTGLSVGNALFRGGQQTVEELLNPVDPLLARDVAALPEAFLGDARFAMKSPYEMPSYAGPRASAAADTIASNSYRAVESSGLTFSPEFVNAALDSTRPASPRELAREATTGRTPVSDVLDNLDTFRDQPMTIQQYQGMMEGLRAKIRGEYKEGALSPTGQQLTVIRKSLADTFEGASASDLSSGNIKDMATFKDANKAYSQARKMETLEDMQDYANGTDNPTTSIKQQVRTFLKSDKKTAGWNDDEIQAMQDAAERGTLGSVMHYMGSRIAPGVAMAIVPGVETALHGAPGLSSAIFSPIAGAVAYGAGGPFRAGGNWLAARRMQNALDIIGQSVPPTPLDLPPP
jgi:hypothetical protein